MKRFTLFILALVCSLRVPAQTPSLPFPPNIVVDGVPPLSATLPGETRRYTELRTATFLSWHPTKLEMLISTRFADAAQVHVVRFPGGARYQLTYFADPVQGAQYDPLHGDAFVFGKDVGGGEWYQNYRYDMTTGEITLLTDGTSRNSPGVWSTAGDRMAYGSTRRNGKDVDFYVMNPSRPSESSLLVQLDDGEGWSVLAWSPDDASVLAKHEISANESSLWLIDVTKHTKALLTPKDSRGQVSYEGGAFSHDGKSVYTTSDGIGEFRQLVSIDIATGKLSPLTPRTTWDVEDFDLTKDGRTIAFVTNEDGIGVLHIYDLALGRDQAVPGLPIGIITNIRWHADGIHLAFTFASSRTGTDVYVLNAPTGKTERWTTSETGGLPVETCAEPQLMHWTTFDGKVLSGFLYNPPSTFTGKRPVMIIIHGGPEGQSRPTFLGRNNYYLNELGIALLYPNVRGSSGYGKTFLKLDNAMLREGSYKDIASLVDWIKTQDRLDPARILVTGGSYGGHMTLAVEAFYSDRIRCAVDIVGISNLVTFLEHTEAYRRDLRRVEYGDERDSTTRTYLEKIAPMNNIAGMKKPLLVIAGKNDPRVPASESQQIVDALKAQGTPVWFLMANDEGHGFRKKNNSDLQFFTTVQFIKTFLLN